MDMTLKAAATAKRNLAQRIERFLETAEQEKIPLGPWETDMLCKALVCLEKGSYRIGEEAMLHIERGDVYRKPEAVAALADAPTLTIAEQRANLMRVLVSGSF